MSLSIIENYLMKVGKSYYRSNEFDAERERLSQKGISIDTCSYFGIGILSCFMVSNVFEIETYRPDKEPLNIRIEGPSMTAL
jgi:HSP90 family molecular chaperone